MDHECGADIIVTVVKDMYGASGRIMLGGTENCVTVRGLDSFFSFKSMLEAYISYLRTGERPFPFDETVELMKLVIASLRSRSEGGRRVALDEIRTD